MNRKLRHQTAIETFHIRQTLSLSAVAWLLAVLVGCGGGGTVQVGGGGQPAPTTGTITGTVADSAGAPVVGALVSIDAAPPVSSDASGNYSVTYDTSAVNTSTTVVVTVAKEGYQTCVGTVNVATGSVAGCNTLTLVSVTELYPAAADAELVRLGDGEATGGTVNSALQIVTPFGLSKTITLPLPANYPIANYQTFTVNLRIRGLQADICADKITVLQGATAATATPLKVFQFSDGNLPNSDVAGAFTSYALALPATLLSAAAGDIHVKLEAGDCGVHGTPADPADDFEFVGLYGNFSAP
jgi:hypothetical protein